MSESGRSGFSLLELLVVVAILGIVAVAAVPSFTSGGGERLDAAASEVAGALRFARGEARRTGALHGVDVETSAGRVRVFRLDAANAKVYDVRHPVDKKLYDLSLAAQSFTAGVQVATAEFRFGGVVAAPPSVAFDRWGTPLSPGDFKLLDSGLVGLSLAGRTRTVTLAAVTGRVTVP